MIKKSKKVANSGIKSFMNFHVFNCCWAPTIDRDPTTLGLLAAIPAVIFYNKLSGDSDKIIAEQESFADEFLLILSRQLESLENRKA